MFFSRLFGLKTPAPKENIATIEWIKGKSGKYFRLISIDENSKSLVQQGGVFIIWAKWGNKTTWLYVGSTADLGKSFKAAKNDPQIMSYEGKGRIGVTWALSNPKYRGRIAAYLKTLLKPVVDKPELSEESNFSTEPFAVYPPAI